MEFSKRWFPNIKSVFKYTLKYNIGECDCFTCKTNGSPDTQTLNIYSLMYIMPTVVSTIVKPKLDESFGIVGVSIKDTKWGKRYARSCTLPVTNLHNLV